MNSTWRGEGKSTYQQMLVEMALDNGKSVLSVGPDHSVLMRRKGHLTLLQTSENRYDKWPPFVYYDDPIFED